MKNKAILIFLFIIIAILALGPSLKLTCLDDDDTLFDLGLNCADLAKCYKLPHPASYCMLVSIGNKDRKSYSAPIILYLERQEKSPPA